MPNVRTKIALSDAEQRELLEQARVLQVASINPDGRPHLVPMWFALDDEGVITFTTYGTSQKVRNLERDPRITVLVEAGEAYNELRGASYDADAEIVIDPQRVARVLALVGAKQAGRPRPDPDPSMEPPPAAYKRVAIRIHPTRVRTWDHRKMG